MNLIDVYGLAGRRIGAASNFPAAKRMQESSLPADLRPAYAGIDTDTGAPLFHADALTPELVARYRLDA